jgi:cyclopropane fatty-acyl-phospholipid synthase-like methyltransferase
VDRKLERITFDEPVPVGLLQVHLSRYVWALQHCVDKAVLDIGCGCGYGTWLVGNVASDVIGLDVSPEAIGEARRTFADSCFVQCAIEDFEGGPFEIVTCFEMLEHTRNLCVVTDKIKSLLAPGGAALFSLPLHQPSEFHHYRDFSYGQWRDVLEKTFRVTGVWFQDVECGCNNVSIRRVMCDDHVDWSEASLRFEPETGNIIFKVTNG